MIFLKPNKYLIMDAIQSHQEFINELEATRKRNSIQYRGWTIEPSTAYPYGGWEFYPTDEGRNEDAEWDGDSWRDCGNVKFASSLDDAKDQIWEKVMEKIPPHEVILHGRSYYFNWVEDAISFAVQWNAEGFNPAVTA